MLHPSRTRRSGRLLLVFLGLALGANAVWLAAVGNLNLGTILVALASASLLIWAWLLGRWRLRMFSVVAASLCLPIAGAAVMLSVSGSRDNVSYDEDAVIVLGASLRGNQLSDTLTSRLETGLDYHERHPDALIVVSGGRSPGEDLAEAVAMRDFLVARGVPTADILVEDRSTSTVENMAFSRELLDQHLAPGYTVAFVTDAFHIYRAGRLADDAGLTARHLHSRTPWPVWTANSLRELVGIVLMWISSRR